MAVLVGLVTAFARWRFAAPLKVEGRARTAYRATRFMALLTLVAIGGWAGLIIAMFTDLDMLSAGNDWMLWSLKGLGVVAFFGTVLVAGWNAWLTWRDGRRWAAKLWSMAVLLAAIVVLYVALAFHLLAFSVNY
ncbi:MAG TPA: hypothetical protein VMQ93_11640 [Novosphingobium sp.]|nr:hypothetical protein [Novosphingobium sp.]